MKHSVFTMIVGFLLLCDICSQNCQAGKGSYIVLSGSNVQNGIIQQDVPLKGQTIAIDDHHGKSCRLIDRSTSSHSIYFNVADDYFNEGAYDYDGTNKSCSVGHISVMYYDGGTDDFALYYDSIDEAHKEVLVSRTGSDTWKWLTLDLDDIYLGNRILSNFDVRFTVAPPRNLCIFTMFTFGPGRKMKA